MSRCSTIVRSCIGVALALGALTTAREGAAQSWPAGVLPPVPVLQLSLPPPPSPSTQWLWLQREGSPAAVYWQTATVPREWRGARDDELRLQLETGRWQLGRLSLSSEISTVPGRERDCEPGCRGAAWSSTLRLKFDAGDLGPLQQVGPELSVGVTPARPGAKAEGLLRGGFSGKF